MAEKNGEIAPRFRILGLLVQNVPGQRHEICSVRLRRVIHFCLAVDLRRHRLLLSEDNERRIIVEVLILFTRGTN